MPERSAVQPSGQDGTDVLLERCVELIPDPALLFDRSGVLVLANAPAAEMFGEDARTMLGLDVEGLLAVTVPELLARLRPDGPDPGRAPTVRGVELNALRRDGTVFPVEVSLREVTGAAEGRSQLVLCTLRDFSAGRQAVDEDLLRTLALVDSARLGIVATTLDGVIVAWNGGAQAVLGHAAEDVVGRSLGGLLSPAANGACTDLGEVLDHCRSERSMDLGLSHRDGRVVVVSVTPSAVVEGAGQVVGYSLVLLDITERTAAEAALAQAKERAENTSREFEAFSYAVAHDLRAPLRAIDGFSQALVEDYPAAIGEEGHAYLAQVRASAKYMGQLIESLLSLARLSTGGLDMRSVDLSELARATIHRFRAADPDRQVEVHIRDGMLGRGDPVMLALVVENLLGNAWKYTSRREGARIEFDRCTWGASPVYYVRDNGVGFDMAYSDKLFGVFQRLHPVEAYEGTGIGLATTRKVLQRHGGRIWAYGEVDRGASFMFTLVPGPEGSDGCRGCVPPQGCLATEP